MPQNYCSPAREKVFERDGTCFNKEALLRLVDAWNERHPDAPIKGVKTKPKEHIWKELNQRLHNICKGDGREWCWVDHLNSAKNSPDVAKSLRPVKPREWYKQPYTWLTNFDIEAVMRQYQDNKEFKFRFLGVYPMDFEGKTGFGTCLFSEMCNLNMASLAKRGFKYVGMVTNLDRHDQDGSHWTALFVCIDHLAPCFGAYYYDSVSNPPPADMKRFMEKIKEQMEEYVFAKTKGKRVEFKTDYNRVRHQYGNSECGLFSMAYIIRWLEVLREKPDTEFNNIVEIKLNDKHVHKLRNELFRPNTKAEVGGGSGGARQKMKILKK